MGHVVIAADDPRADDVAAMLRRHLEFAHEHTPIEHAYALGVDGLLDPAVTFFAARRDGELLAVGALKELDEGHGEVKSMHTAATARRQGVARAMVELPRPVGTRCGARGPVRVPTRRVLARSVPGPGLRSA